jgi:hypothetical protein
MPNAAVIAGAATCYAALLPTLQKVARECGYALAVHGTMTRDLDLIAAPWTEEATDDETLTEALRAACGGKIYGAMHDGKTGKTDLNPVSRPHGRKGWVIHLGGPYLDVSVMPRMPRNDQAQRRRTRDAASQINATAPFSGAHC